MKKARYRLESYLQNQVTAGEKTVLLYILENTREVCSMDIHSLAKKGFCSAATIIRLCKKNGFKGFKDLKLALLNDLKFDDELIEAKFNTGKSSDLNSRIVNVLNENIRAINNTFNLVDLEEINKIINYFDRSDTIRLFGIGASFLVAKDLQQKLERVNKQTILFEDTHLQIISSSNIKQNQLTVIISYSGMTKEIITMAENIKKAGGIIVAITKYQASKLSNLANFKIYVPEIESPLRVGASSSRISQLSAVDILFHSYIYLSNDSKMDLILKTNKMFEK